MVDGVGAQSTTSLTLMVQRSTQHHQSTAFKVDPPKPFDGKTLDGTALESWLYQMNLYFSIETGLPENLRVARAALLLTGNAATWFRAQGWDPTTLTWPQL